MTAYYNEIDPFAAQWLRNLIKAGHIADGEVDTRSIEDVRPNDLDGFTQCHFFAGIGVWSHALRQAGWGDDRPVWTGSCPCQSFSVAGKGSGFADKRHLWPAFFHLIKQCKPATVFGEQVEAAIRYSWLDLVQTDLENSGYAFAAAGINSAGFGAPHIRQRLYFVAHAIDARRQREPDEYAAGILGTCVQPSKQWDMPSNMGAALSCMANNNKGSQGRVGVPERSIELAAGQGGLAGWLSDTQQHSDKPQIQTARDVAPQADRPTDWTGGRGVSLDGMDNGISHGWDKGRHDDAQHDGQQLDTTGDSFSLVITKDNRHIQRNLGNKTNTQCTTSSGGEEPNERCRRNDAAHASPTNGFWRDADWIGCRDGKWRPVEPGTQPLAPRSTGHVGRLRGYGNAITAPVAQNFIEAYMECQP